jgi:perosamine synthetase
VRLSHPACKHQDERGQIIDILGPTPIEYVTLITSARGVSRGNHYHRDTVQTVYILEGRLKLLSQRPNEAVVATILERGDLCTTEPLERHAMLALEDSVFLVFTRGPRGGDNYEADTYRVDPLVEESPGRPSQRVRTMIPVCEPLLSEDARRYVDECLRTGWISSEGRFVVEFERRWAAYCGMDHGVAVSSGTAALEVALEVLDLAPGDEVIMPTFTIVSCVLAVLRARATPVLVDSDPATWCMDVAQVRDRVGPRTRAIMPVHMYGHPVDMDPLLELARERGLMIVEDAAEAHGAEYKGRRVGGLGDVSCFSFYANKIISTGEGGMVLARRPEHADRIRSLRNLCFRSDRRFYHTALGHNFRLTNLQAAVGLAQVENIEEHLRRKRWLGRAYTDRLQGLAQITLPTEAPWAKNVYWMYGLVLGDDVRLDAVEFARRLRELGVETRPFFLGMHEQPVAHDLGLFRGERYPVAERLARRGLYLPSGLTLTEPQLEGVTRAVRKVLEQSS